MQRISFVSKVRRSKHARQTLCFSEVMYDAHHNTSFEHRELLINQCSCKDTDLDTSNLVSEVHMASTAIRYMWSEILHDDF